LKPTHFQHTLEEPMERDHFEILLEEMNNNFQLAFEGLAGVNRRLDTMDDRFSRFEAGLETVKAGVCDIKLNTGILNSIANDHETRLQVVEFKLKDHID
jgi:hypothetical protein